jgi:hypothetical protein
MIVAFLQNMWVRNPARINEMLRRERVNGDSEALRLRLIEYCLFAGCVTGRRLKKAFGQELIDQIVWEETTREIADNPKTIFPAQPEHILGVIIKHSPVAIVTFGKIAEVAVRPLWGGKLISAPHPAARQADVPSRLSAIGSELKALLDN